VARGFHQDYHAITAVLTTPWSAGQCEEGQLYRVKLLKRLGYGRTKLDLLRLRILHRVVVLVMPDRAHGAIRPRAVAYRAHSDIGTLSWGAMPVHSDRSHFTKSADELFLHHR
jgi:hypothetical protein